MSEHRSVSYLEVSSAQAEQRLDNFLFKTIKTIPKSRLYKALRKGEVRVNKKRVKPEYRIQAGDQIRLPPLEVPTSAAELAPPDWMIDELLKCIIYETPNLLVINKPKGLAVHGGTGLRFGAIDLLRKPYPNLELVHRLDRETSGCLMFAKNRKTLLYLHDLLQTGQVEKHYIAITQGPWPTYKLRVDKPIIKSPGDKPKEAVTEFEVLSARRDCARVHANLLTGRTHQIRIHCASVGCPVLGDNEHGDFLFNKAKSADRLYLHAHTVAFLYEGRLLKITAPVPLEFDAFGV